ncbi:DUF2288 family protein [Haloferula chungangensis]|uniref:DUF2288 family protein n=1 Tax=Haloferula chungangensis TaxID=1048331 RepID=A0ABW2L4K4_9BACT
MSSQDQSNSEPMKYALLGKDTSTNEEKLEKFTGEVNWSYLRPHYQSGVLFFVDPSLPLQHVGAAIAADELGRVKDWMKTGDIVKIASLHAAQWEGSETVFEALVVSPFVLCRPVG